MPRLPIAGNLIANGDFEIVPTLVAAQTGAGYIDGNATGSAALATAYGWHAAGGGTRSVQFDTTEKYEGTASLKIAVTANASYAEIRSNQCNTYNQARGFILQPSTQYTYSYRLKTTDMVGDAAGGVYGILVLSTAAGTAGSSPAQGTAVKVNTNWTLYTVTFTTSATDYFGHFEARFYGHNGTGTLKGNAYFDVIRVYKTTQVRVAAS